MAGYLLNPLGGTTSHSTRLQETAAKSLVIPQAGEEANESLREFYVNVRIVLDTNTLVSGVISPGGAPRRLLDGARTQTFELCSSVVLMTELLDVLSREKFAVRLAQAGLTPLSIVRELRRLAYMVRR